MSELEDICQQHVPEDEITEQFINPVIPKEFKGSYNLGSFPRLETHWRDREIKSIITGGDKKSKELLRRFAPFDDIIAASLRISVPQTDLPGINWHAFFPGSLNHREPSNVAADISTASWTCFQQVPFYSWARLALGFEDKAVQSFKWCHEGLKLHVWHYLRTHVDQLPRFLLLVQASEQQNPFVYSALFSGINIFLTRQQAHSALEPDFILRPLVGLLNNKRLVLQKLLRILNTLEVLYRNEYQGTARVNWQSDFPTTIDLYSASDN